MRNVYVILCLKTHVNKTGANNNGDNHFTGIGSKLVYISLSKVRIFANAKLKFLKIVINFFFSNDVVVVNVESWQ